MFWFHEYEIFLNIFTTLVFISYEGGRNRVCFLDGEMTVPLGTMRALFTGDFVTIKDGEIFFLGRKGQSDQTSWQTS